MARNFGKCRMKEGSGKEMMYSRERMGGEEEEKASVLSLTSG